MTRKITLISLILVFCIVCTVLLTGCGNNKNAADIPTETQTAKTGETEAVTEAMTEAETKETATQAQAETTASAESSPLIGSWEYEEMEGFTYIFNADGTGKYDVLGEVINFTYIDNGDSFTLTYDDVDTPSTIEYVIEGDTLTVKDSIGESVRYIKK